MGASASKLRRMAFDGFVYGVQLKREARKKFVLQKMIENLKGAGREKLLKLHFDSWVDYVQYDRPLERIEEDIQRQMDLEEKQRQ